MMRVTVVNPIGLVGGAERVLLAGLRAVRSQFAESAVQLLLLQDGPLREAALKCGASVDVVPLPESLTQLGETQYRSGGRLALVPKLVKTLPTMLLVLNQLRDRIRRFRPSVIHSHGVKAHLFTRLIAPRGVPVLGTIHDLVSERPLTGKLLKHVGGLTHGLAISHAVQRDLLLVDPKLPVTTIHNMVDVQAFSPGPGDGAKLDRDSGLPVAEPGTLRAGLVATYANWKGHKLFLEALARLKDLPLRGYIIGGAIYSTPGSQVSQEELVELVQQLGLTGRVGFLPFQRDPAPVYRSLDIAVHASTRPEPFGLTILEAMSCGKPVVVSAAGGAVEIFEDGISAMGFPLGDAGKLADCLRRYVQDAALRERVGRAARERALHFGEDRFAQEYAALLNRLCSVRSSGE